MLQLLLLPLLLPVYYLLHIIIIIIIIIIIAVSSRIPLPLALPLLRQIFPKHYYWQWTTIALTTTSTYSLYYVFTIALVSIGLLVLIVMKVLILFGFHGLIAIRCSLWSQIFTIWKTHDIVLWNELIKLVLLRCALVCFRLIAIWVWRALGALWLITCNCNV